MFKILNRISAVLWVIWGIVHMMAAVIIIPSTTTEGFQGIGDAVPPAELENQYHELVGAVLNQHGWNLGWIGLTTLICAFFIWKGNGKAAFLAALVGGLADVGYFVFIDLGGFGNFLPGGLMTYVSGSAIILTAVAFTKFKEEE